MGVLVIAGPPATSGWITTRFGRVLDEAAQAAGRRWRFASEPERVALDQTERLADTARGLEITHKEASR